ncbi:hypothetical protein ERJ75_000521900 [Trypanosoma vivax]|nr:hypothetical protein ERJ75_000521900 [Trypanosoma vivax]
MAAESARRLSWTLQCLAILASGAAHFAQDRAASVDPANLCSSARGEGSKRRPGEKQASLDRQPSKHRSAKPPASHTATRHKRREDSAANRTRAGRAARGGGPDSGMPAQRTELALRRRTGDVHQTAARVGQPVAAGRQQPTRGTPRRTPLRRLLVATRTHERSKPPARARHAMCNDNEADRSRTRAGA